MKGCKLTLWLDYECSSAVLSSLSLVENELHSSYRSTCCRRDKMPEDGSRLFESDEA